MYDIIIVGGGTAGLSAAIYSVRAGKSALVLEQKGYGGQIVNSPEVANYPGIRQISGFEFAKGLYEQATGLGAEFKLAQVVGIESTQEPDGIKRVVTRGASGEETVYEARAVILATGAKNRPLGLEREEELTGAGVSYCATCDGMFFRGKDVAVAGGGSTALEDALFLSGVCGTVYLIHRRDQCRGEERLVEALREKENVVFMTPYVVRELRGDKSLASIEIQNTATGEERELEVSGLFVAIGQMPDNRAFSGLVDIDDKGYIRAAEDCLTGTPGIFTAGDCRTKAVRQLATAASDGAVAGLAACEYIG